MESKEAGKNPTSIILRHLQLSKILKRQTFRNRINQFNLVLRKRAVTVISEQPFSLCIIELFPTIFQL